MCWLQVIIPNLPKVRVGVNASTRSTAVVTATIKALFSMFLAFLLSFSSLHSIKMIELRVLRVLAGTFFSLRTIINIDIDRPSGSERVKG